MIEEISRRCKKSIFEEIVCAEICLKADGVTQYLTASWISMTPEEVSIELTVRPVLDILTGCLMDSELDELDQIRAGKLPIPDDKEYSALSLELSGMVLGTAVRSGLLEMDEEQDKSVLEFDMFG